VLGLEKSQKSILGIIGIVVIAIGVGSFFFFEVIDSGETIKIGVTLPITGAASNIGEQIRNGMLMAVDEINSRDGINGKNIELIFVDNETNLEKTKKDFLEIEETHAPLMYISSLSSLSTAVSPLAEENEVVLIAIGATAPGVTKQKEWTYRYFPTAGDEVIPIIRILKDFNVNNLGILYQNDEFGRSVLVAVETEFENDEVTISKEFFAPDAVYYKDQIAKLQNEDAIVMIAWPEHVELILKQIRETDYQGHIIGSSDAATPFVFNMPEANGMYLATPAIYDSNFLFARTISENFEPRYNKQFDHWAANGYDIVKILGGLLENEELSRDNVKRILDRGFSYSGVFGNVDALPGEHDSAFPLFPSKVVNGKLEFRR
jgi:branched-chain amino acid transport system substrate-binding protein